MIVLGLIAVVSAVSANMMAIKNQPMHKIIIALEAIAARDLAKLLILSPLNRGLLGDSEQNDVTTSEEAYYVFISSAKKMVGVSFEGITVRARKELL
jgi:hypothetical protein